MEVWFCALAGTDAARHSRADRDRRVQTELKRKETEDDMQHRRLRLRSASQGSAPAAQCHSTATKENQEHLSRVLTGNSVSPLDKTYHGGPRTIS